MSNWHIFSEIKKSEKERKLGYWKNKTKTNRISIHSVQSILVPGSRPGIANIALNSWIKGKKVVNEKVINHTLFFIFY